MLYDTETSHKNEAGSSHAKTSPENSNIIRSRARTNTAHETLELIASDTILQIKRKQFSWRNFGSGNPLNFRGVPYEGINRIVLWSSMQKMGFSSPHWYTFNRIKQMGGYLLEGSKSTRIMYYARCRKIPGLESGGFCIKWVCLFNAEQTRDIFTTEQKPTATTHTQREVQNFVVTMFNKLAKSEPDFKRAHVAMYNTGTGALLQKHRRDCGNLLRGMISWVFARIKSERADSRTQSTDAECEYTVDIAVSFVLSDYGFLRSDIREEFGSNGINEYEPDSRSIFNYAREAGKVLRYLKRI